MTQPPLPFTEPAPPPRPATPPLGAGTRFWYGFGQIAEGVKNHSFQAFLLFYYTQVLGLAGSLAGLALALALVFDAVTDPMAGVLSDRFESRFGRRHPFMYAAAIPLGLAFTLVFAPPEGLSQSALFGWLLASVVATRAAMTLYHVPHMALGAELTDDYEERTRVVLVRNVGAAVGAASAGGFALLYFLRPTAEFENGQLNPAGYPGFAVAFGVVMAVTVLASAVGTHSRIPYLPRPDAVAKTRGAFSELLHSLGEVLKIPSFRALFFGVTLVFIAFGVGGVLGLHLATYFWRVTTEQIFWWGAGSIAGTLTGMVFWVQVANRTDKKPTFLAGLYIFIAFAALPLFAKIVGFWPAHDSPFYVPLWIGVGYLYSFGLAASVVTGGSMMADVADQDELIFGRRREGIFFGAAALAAKSSVGLGSLLAGGLVEMVGLLPEAKPEDVPIAVADRLGLATGLVLFGLVALAAVFFTRYSITRDVHVSIRAELDRRHEKEELAGG